jgi:phosphopantothenoylcysteine decarboxylase/phosphopantothenate--cysteine ligase
VSDAKIKKAADGSAPVLHLVQNPDILAELVSARSGTSPLVVGFAAETGDDERSVEDYGREKLARKGCDLLVVNDVSGGKVFGHDTTEAVVLAADGSATAVPFGAKDELAESVWTMVRARLPAR